MMSIHRIVDGRSRIEIVIPRSTKQAIGAVTRRQVVIAAASNNEKVFAL
jgi:hypothetical protein